jgi:hypothetical protein
MGALQSTLPWDPFQDPEVIKGKIAELKGMSPSTSSSSLASAANQPYYAGGPSPTSASAMLMGTDAPPLYEHALVGDWDALLKRVVSHPKEAKYQDKCKNMPLHVCCRRQPPPDVVEALIRAHPEALSSTTMDGLTPLHFACFCGSEPLTVQKVVPDDVQSLRDFVDRRGRTPLHCVCAGFRSPHRLQVLQLLLEMDPTCAIAQDERGRTPLSLMVDDYAEELQDALKDETSASVAREKCISEKGDLFECWNATSLLLRAAFKGTIKDETPASENEINVDGKFLVLHAAVGVGGCPSAFIRLILKIDPDAISRQDGDLSLPLHIACRTVGQPWSRNYVTKSSRQGSVVYNADFGRPKQNGRTRKTEDDDMTAELLAAYPEAADMADEFGKVPFVLAVESGKPWKTSLEPLWEAHMLEEESFQLLQEALDGALTSVSESLRSETIATLGRLAHLWPVERVNAWTMHIVDFAREGGGFTVDKTGRGTSDESSWSATLQASSLEGLASVLSNLPKSYLQMPDTPQQALDIALPLLTHKEASVRVGAANVLGASITLLGPSARERAFLDVVFPVEDVKDDQSISTMGHSCSTVGESEIECLHGRAIACQAVLKSCPQLLTEPQRKTLKGWMKHDEVVVRMAACLAVGPILCTSSDLKEYRSSLLKCLRTSETSEDESVHLAVARSLTHAAKTAYPEKLFLCKAGLPFLDTALMFSSTTAVTSKTQHAFHVFLWWAIQNQEDGLQTYMDLAPGNNGHIMMTLITRTLSNLVVDPQENYM